MIDNEQTEQIEELEDVVIDLAEDEGKQPEETSDTESPITAEAEEETDTKVFHSGTRNEGKRIVTCGGRVLCVVGLGDSVKAAQTKALKRIKGLKWDGMFYRADIGHRAINTE